MKQISTVPKVKGCSPGVSQTSENPSKFG